MNLVNRLLKKNLSMPQMAAFTVANFLGLAIVIAGIQIYLDVKGLWQDEDSFVKKDYMVINKKVTSSTTFGTTSSGFSEEELNDLKAQPWVRKIGKFTSLDYRMMARVAKGDKSMQTMMFCDAIPSEFIDVADETWKYTAGDSVVPIIISKDYLTLYNFGFANSVGFPKMSEGIFETIPLYLNLSNADYSKQKNVTGKIVGFSNRLNTILVPQEFLDWSNGEFGDNAGKPQEPSRLILDVSKPGDPAINQYVESRGWEIGGDKSGSQASFLVNIIAVTVVAIGIVITILSFFVLLLSISLLMTKNRDKLHALIMLGYSYKTVGAPYRKLVMQVCCIAWLLAVGATFGLRATYIGELSQMTEVAGNIWLAPLIGLVITVCVIFFNLGAVRKRVMASRYLR